MSRTRTIVLDRELAIHEEAVAGAAGLKPGMLGVINSSGQIVAAAAAGAANHQEILVVTEDALQGKTVDDAYANAAVVSYAIPQRGCRCNLLILDGEAIALADEIVHGASGKAIEGAGTEKVRLGRAIEAASPSGADALAAVRMY